MNDRSLYFGLLAILALMIVYALIVVHFTGGPNGAGTFGDMFGGINALFTGFALAGLIYTIYQQRTQLTMHREEIKQMRREFMIQNKTMRLQRFENTFFKMLEYQHNVLRGISRSGESGISHLKNRLVELLDSHPKAERSERVTTACRTLAEEDENGLLLDHFFNGLQSILTLVDSSEILDKPDRLFYVSLITSLLSTDELILIFFYTVTTGSSTSSEDSYITPELISLVKRYELAKPSQYRITKAYADLYAD